MFCIKCGKEIPDKAIYCQACGALQKVKENSNEGKRTGSKRKSKKKLWLLLIPVILAVCLGIGFLIFFMIRGIRGEWTMESIGGIAIEDAAKYRGVDVEEVAVNVSIEEDTITFSTLSGGSDLDMELVYEKKGDNVWEAYPVDQFEVRNDVESTMVLNYDLLSDKITITRKSDPEQMTDPAIIVLARGTTHFTKTDGSTTVYNEYDEKQKESKDLRMLDSIYSAFVSAIGNLGIDVCDSTELTGDLAEEVEELLGQSIEECKAEFESEVCKGKDLYFYANPVTGVIRVAVGSREGVNGEASDLLFYASNENNN